MTNQAPDSDPFLLIFDTIIMKIDRKKVLYKIRDSLSSGNLLFKNFLDRS